MKLKHLILALFVVSATIAAHHVAAQVPETADANTGSNPTDSDLSKKFPNSMQYTIADSEGKPLAQIAYRVTFPSGITAKGVTDEYGHTVRFRTKNPERLSLAVKATNANVAFLPSASPH
ncbi:hypothetical protein [Paraburkholderia phytofirmans]|uniref:Uncharacterized protein n=1 Tax=Paraburkholderia phytofirmans TaxID=261302 RepID=A0ABW9BED5_9BURK|nr:hypothetical protein [Paraburkholderia phytofirmans]